MPKFELLNSPVCYLIIFVLLYTRKNPIIVSTEARRSIGNTRLVLSYHFVIYIIRNSLLFKPWTLFNPSLLSRINYQNLDQLLLIQRTWIIAYQRSTKRIRPTQHARQHSSLLVVDNQRRHATYAASDRIQKLFVISGGDPKGTVPGSATYIL